jgi:serine/threonine protein kinase
MSDRYEIKAKIGEGGAGAVYRAWDVQTKSAVAIKRMLGGLSGEATEDARGDLMREAAMLSGLRHPNICHVSDFGCDDDGGFVAMEFINGNNLERAAKRQTSIEEFAEITMQMLEGLAYAHHRNVLHGDLKPSNVMIDWLPGGQFRVKLLDFGLARFSARPMHQEIDHVTHTTKGSVFFMAPEQFENLALDTRTDLYSLGCLCFYLLTGQHAFTGETPAIVAQNHLQHHINTSLSVLRPETPAPLRQWVAWLMNRDPKNRPTSALEALESLKELGIAKLPASVAAEAETSAQAQNRSTRRRGKSRSGAARWVLPVCAGVILLAAGAAWFLRPPSATSAPPAGPPALMTGAPMPDWNTRLPQEKLLLTLRSDTDVLKESGHPATVGNQIATWNDQASYGGPNNASDRREAHVSPTLAEIENQFGLRGRHPVVSFDRSHWLEIGGTGAAVPLDSFGTDELTLIAVYRIAKTRSVDQRILSCRMGTLEAAFTLTSTKQGLIRSGLRRPDKESNAIEIPFGQDSFIISSTLWHRSADRFSLRYTDSTGRQFTAPDIPGRESPGGLSNIRIGANSEGLGLHLVGDIAALVLYDRALTDAERTSVESMLASHYFGVRQLTLLK